MAYEAKGSFAKNAESGIEIFSMISEHSSWLANFYSNETANFWKAYGEYSSRAAKEIGGVIGSMAQIGMGNMGIVARTMSRYSVREEPAIAKAYEIEHVPVASEPLKEIEVTVQMPQMEVIILENRSGYSHTPNKRMIIA